MDKQKFSLGKIVWSSGVNEKLAVDTKFAEFVIDALRRYSQGDWGDIDEVDKWENDFSVDKFLRIFSAYVYPKDHTKIWVITEADRSATTVLFPEEY